MFVISEIKTHASFSYFIYTKYFSFDFVPLDPFTVLGIGPLK